MPFHGSIVVIKRSGFDGSVFPLVNGDCLMGRAETCDIRVQLPTVSDEHCRIEVNENDEARLVCLSTNVGQTQINGKFMDHGSSEMLYHQAIFTVGDRSFRWEYPNDSALIHRRSNDVLTSPRKTPTPKVLTPNNGKTKGTAVARYCSPNMDEDIKKAIPILDLTSKSSIETPSVASKAIEAAIKAAIPSPRVLQTPKSDAPIMVSSTKRVSFGPYVSPEIIDKELPPSTPVKKGAEPLNASLDLNPLSNIKSPKVMGTLNLEDTPSTMIKSKLKKKIAKKPENESIKEEPKHGVLKRNPNDTPIIKDNSGYRASPRRIDALTAATSKQNSASVDENKLTKINTPKKTKDSESNCTPEHGRKSRPSNPRLTKSTIKIKPAQNFYGSTAAKTPKGSKRKLSVENNQPSANKRSKQSPKPAKMTAATLRITKSTVKVKKTNDFYGNNAAKTPKGAKSNKRLATPIERSSKKAKLTVTKEFSGKQDSLKKARSVNLEVSNSSKTPRKKVEVKKKLWSEIAKKTPAKKPAALIKATKAQRAIKRVRNNVKDKTPGKMAKPSKAKCISAHHATSPETITITKKNAAKVPTVLAKKGKKTPSKSNRTPSRKISLSVSKSTKKLASKIETTSSPNKNKSIQSIKSSPSTAPKSITRRTAKRISLQSPTNHTPISSKSPGQKRKILSPEFDQLSSPLNETTFDFDSIKTPAIPLETFVSPISSQDRPKKILREPKTPNMKGLREMMASPKEMQTPDLRGIKKLMASPKNQKTPKMDGLKPLLATPKSSQTPDLRGIKKMMISPKPQKTPKMAGIKRMYATPKSIKTPDMRGIRKMMISPKSQKTPRMAGIKRMFVSDKDTKTPRLAGIKPLFISPKDTKTPDMRGLKRMVKTPKEVKSPRLGGIKKLLNTPKEIKTPNMIGIKHMFVSPKNDLTPSYEGLSSLVKTPASTNRSSRKESSKTLKNNTKTKSTSTIDTDLSPIAKSRSPPTTFTHSSRNKKTVATSPISPKSTSPAAKRTSRIKDMTETSPVQKATRARTGKRRVVIVSPSMDNNKHTHDPVEATSNGEVATLSTKPSRQKRAVVQKLPVESAESAKSCIPAKVPKEFSPRKKRAVASKIGSMKELAGNKKLRREDSALPQSITDQTGAKNDKQCASSKSKTKEVHLKSSSNPKKIANTPCSPSPKKQPITSALKESKSTKATRKTEVKAPIEQEIASLEQKPKRKRAESSTPPAKRTRTRQKEVTVSPPKSEVNATKKTSKARGARQKPVTESPMKSVDSPKKTPKARNAKAKSVNKSPVKSDIDSPKKTPMARKTRQKSVTKSPVKSDIDSPKKTPKARKTRQKSVTKSPVKEDINSPKKTPKARKTRGKPVIKSPGESDVNSPNRTTKTRRTKQKDVSPSPLKLDEPAKKTPKSRASRKQDAPPSSPPKRVTRSRK